MQSFDPKVTKPRIRRCAALCPAQVMPPFDHEMVEPLHAYMRSKGCKLYLGDGVAGFEQGPGGKGLVVKTQGGKAYNADLVMLVGGLVWGGGGLEMVWVGVCVGGGQRRPGHAGGWLVWWWCVWAGGWVVWWWWRVCVGGGQGGSLRGWVGGSGSNRRVMWVAGAWWFSSGGYLAGRWPVIGWQARGLQLLLRACPGAL